MDMNIDMDIRFAIYHKQTEPLISDLLIQNRLTRIDGTHELQQIYHDVDQILEVWKDMKISLVPREKPVTHIERVELPYKQEKQIKKMPQIYGMLKNVACYVVATHV